MFSGLLRAPVSSALECGGLLYTTEAVVLCTAAKNALQGFQKLLPWRPDPQVLATLVTYFAREAEMANTPGQAIAVYNRAKDIPGTTTCVQTAKESGVSLNGKLLPNFLARCTLLYAFRGSQPYLCKIPIKSQDAEREVAYYESITARADPLQHHLAGPISILEIQVCPHTE